MLFGEYLFSQKVHDHSRQTGINCWTSDGPELQHCMRGAQSRRCVWIDQDFSSGEPDRLVPSGVIRRHLVRTSITLATCPLMSNAYTVWAQW